MTRSLISELAQRLGKSEEEVIQFFQILWQVMPPSPETQPYFFRYLDERFMRLEDRYTTLRQEMEQRLESLRKEMLQQIEALRKEMQQGDAALLQQIEALRKDMGQQTEAVLREVQHGDTLLRQEIEAIRRHIERMKKWLFALTVPVFISMLSILGILLQAFLSR